ncbi:MAG: hypothetical protein IT384_33975 [Deltaproteobacteria bacterium]|nr:hypothetical protein [Deltaproteobacteria bacterium]
MGRRCWLLKIAACSVAMTMSSPAFAGCKSDCRDEYDDAVDSCQLIYDDPDDADMLQMCIDDARSDYDDCIEECDS